ncbi:MULTISPECIES: DUF2752 domain-containing protein [unclassified Luteococcus]|uniref:DUF2752 domain-containing protein n=1 Tax=unclassified Luteococcus TaxID=2639923 RepID=UPI00313A8631
MDPAPFDARRALRGVGSLALVCAGQAALVLILGRGVPCPLRVTTGLLCPVCGTTTAGMHLLHGRWNEAWQANPFTLLIGGVLTLCTTAWLVEALGGPAIRPPRSVRPVTMDRILILLAGPAVAFAVWRNLL